MSTVRMKRSDLQANDSAARSAFRLEDVQHVKAVDAQLHSMESYINPDVYDALRFRRRHAEMVGEAASSLAPPSNEEESKENDGTGDDALGVALIQPVTSGIEYCETRRALFPTQRSLSVNVEPVSTMLSFEDLQLIEAVLSRWSSGRTRDPSINDEDGDTVERPFSKDSSGARTYDVVFHSARLGLGLKMDGGVILVDSVHDTESGGSIEVGDVLFSIDGLKLEATSLAEVVRQLSEAERPTKITFSSSSHTQRISETVTGDVARKENSAIDVRPRPNIRTTSVATIPDIDGLAESFTLRFHVGISNGLQLEKSSSGGFPVVKQVDPVFNEAATTGAIDERISDEIETVNIEFDEIRIPRVGAVIVAVNGDLAEGLGYEEIVRRLEGFAGDVAVAGSEVYSLSFMELDSSLWGSIDNVDISAAGVALAFIDDLNGRDMPLFRGNLSSVEVHFERGLGIEASILDVPAPGLLKLYGDNPDSGTGNAIFLSREMIEDFPTDSVVTFSAIAMCTIEYYHPRIAVWELLLEPSRLFLLLEMQAGS
jgi:hypothetical protein